MSGKRAKRQRKEARYRKNLRAMDAAGDSVVRQYAELAGTLAPADAKAATARLSELGDMLRDNPWVGGMVAQGMDNFARAGEFRTEITPRCAEKIHGTNQYLYSNPPRYCEHLTDIVINLALCMSHPAQKLRCFECHDAHVEGTHTREQELTCDECGTVEDRIFPVILIPSVGVAVTLPSGETQPYPGPVHLFGLGHCATCRKSIRAGG